MTRAGDLLWELDNVELTSVGMDVGSATSHLMISRILLQRQGLSLSSRFVPIERTVLYRSPVILTPYRSDNELIDVDGLAALVDRAHDESGVAADQIDTGVVILTGVALHRPNARSIGEHFAARTGSFVCASAGHRFEAMLAAHGSGAVQLSESVGEPVLNIDIGGGTTKISQIQDGRVLESMIITVGARLVVVDDQSHVIRVEPEILPFAEQLGIDVTLGSKLGLASRRRLADLMAEAVVTAASGRPARAGNTGASVVIEGELDPSIEPARTVYSGGVAEYIRGAENREFGDLGPYIADSLTAHAGQVPPVDRADRNGIRATVAGASQNSVSLSGNTVHIGEAPSLPLTNLPVVRAELGAGDLDATAVRSAIDHAAKLRELDPARPAALMLGWHGPPAYANLRALADGVAASLVGVTAVAGETTLVVIIDNDVSALVGRILRDELGITDCIVIDGIDLSELDYVDLGRQRQPAGTVPAIIKSLLFG